MGLVNGTGRRLLKASDNNPWGGACECGRDMVASVKRYLVNRVIELVSEKHSNRVISDNGKKPLVTLRGC